MLDIQSPKRLQLTPTAGPAPFIMLAPSVQSAPSPPAFVLGGLRGTVARSYFGDIGMLSVGCYEIRHGAVTSHGLVLYNGALVLCDQLNISEGSIAEAGLYGPVLENQAPSRELAGTLVSLVGPGHLIYGHWLVDFLPKLFILDQLGIDPRSVYYLLPDNTPPSALEWLHLLGLSDDQLVFYDPYREVVAAERLILPTLLRTSARPHPLFRAAAKYLLSILTDRNVIPAVQKPFQRIFISRANAGRDGRTMVNRAEVEALATEAGFKIMRPESMTIADQVALFANARQIMGEYGSGLHGSIFAPRGSFVCAFRAAAFHPGFLQSGICQVLGQKIGYVFGDADDAAVEQRFRVDPDDVRWALRLMALDRSAATNITQPTSARRAKNRPDPVASGQHLVTAGAEAFSRANWAELERLRAEHRIVLESTTWKATRPLRTLFTHSPGVRRAIRRCAKACWYILNLRPHLVINAVRRRISARRAASRTAALRHADPTLAMVGQDQAPPPPSRDHRTEFADQARRELRQFLDGDSRIIFEPQTQPAISILIVLWNSAYLTLRCLQALSRANSVNTFELILFDNASTDETASLLGRVDGAKIISHDTNAGFVTGCNSAAAVSSGRALLLLNSDAFVRPGTLDAAIETLEASPDVGAVGGRLIRPDQLLQEAGSIVWRDGSALGYGLRQDSEWYSAMFRRDVDYCSGAFLMTKREVWKRLGGLDERYSPAYYEETDYCMRLREIGLRVVYDPRAVVDHFEFGSQTSSDWRHEINLRNRKIFRNRHRDTLVREHLPCHPRAVIAARERARPGQRKLLIIDDAPPLRVLGSGFPRMQEIVAGSLAEGWTLALYATNYPDVDWKDVRSEVTWDVEVIAGRGAPDMLAFLDERQGEYDAILVSRPHNMERVQEIIRIHPHLFYGVRLIYDAEALFSTRDLLKARITGGPTAAEEFDARLDQEIAIAQAADAISCVSRAEAAAFATRLKATVEVLSYSGALQTDRPDFTARSGLLFVGRLLERDAPNWDGLVWFVKHVWPSVRAGLPEATLTIVGLLYRDTSSISGPGITLAGPQDDLLPFYRRARVFIAPVRYAAGIPTKIIDATFAGIPVAGTSLMAQQLEWTADREMVAADNPMQLAAGIIELYSDRSKWERIGSAARFSVETRFSSAVFRRTLSRLLSGPDRA